MKYYLNHEYLIKNSQSQYFRFDKENNRWLYKSELSHFWYYLDKPYENRRENDRFVNLIPDNDPKDGLAFFIEELLTEEEYLRKKHTKVFNEKVDKIIYE